MLKVTTGEQWDYVISVNLHPKATELHWRGWFNGNNKKEFQIDNTNSPYIPKTNSAATLIGRFKGFIL